MASVILAYIPDFCQDAGEGLCVRTNGLCYNLISYCVENQGLEAIEVARQVVAAASDKQASDIVLLDTRNVCSFADYFVICAGDSERQLRAIYEEIEQGLKKKGILPHHREGTIDSGWLLLDYGDVIVHIFGAVERAYYRLDELWREAKPVLRIQ